MSAKSLGEVSGCAFSRVDPNRVWVHNDSGDGPYIFPVDPELLLHRTGYACVDETDFPLNSVDGENAWQFFDQTCEVETEQNARLAKMRASRSNDEVKRALTAIRDAARKGENVMPSLVAASLVRCTLGEQVQAMADVYGRYSGGPEW